MIIKGNSRGSPAALAGHLLSAEHNESAELVELDGVAAEDLRGALIEMDARAAGSRCTRTLYHASINMAPDEALTPDQWREAVCRLETELGFEGQPRAVVRHVKDGREHVHIVWSRYDLDHDRAIPDSHNYAAHERVSRALEREFGHERVQGVHVDADRSQARPVAALSHAEWQQAERTGIDARHAKQEITAAWRESADGPAFVQALAERGYVLARGDRRDCVVIDEAGGLHSLRRRLDGVKAPEITAKLAGMNRLTLPNVEQARAIQAERAREGTGREEGAGGGVAVSAEAPPAGRIDPRQVKREVTEAWREAPDGKAFVQALAERGYELARGDRRDLVIIDQAGGLHGLRRRLDGVKAPEIKAKMAGFNRLTLPSVEQARATQAERTRGEGRGGDIAPPILDPKQARREAEAVRFDAERCAREREQLERRLQREAAEALARKRAELELQERREREELARLLEERRQEAERRPAGLGERLRRAVSPERARQAREAEAARRQEREELARGRWELLELDITRRRQAELARVEEWHRLSRQEAPKALERSQAERRDKEAADRRRMQEQARRRQREIAEREQARRIARERGLPPFPGAGGREQGGRER